MPASCSGGVAIDSMTEMADTFMKVYFTKSVGVMNMTLQGCLGLWMAWQITRLATGRPINLDQAKEQLFYFIVSLALLSVPDRIWELFDITRSLAYWAAKNAYMVAAPATAEIPVSIGDIGCQASTMMNSGVDGGMMLALRELHLYSNLANLLCAALATLPMLAIAWKGIRNIWAPQLRIFAVGILLPFIMGFACFPQTRSTVLTAIRLLLTSAVQVVLVAATIGLIAAMFNQTVIDSPMGYNNGVITEKNGTYYSSREYWDLVFALFLAWLSFEEVLAIGTAMFNTVVAQTRGLLGGLM
jgi:hypothetical protein